MVLENQSEDKYKTASSRSTKINEFIGHWLSPLFDFHVPGPLFSAPGVSQL